MRMLPGIVRKRTQLIVAAAMMAALCAVYSIS